MDESGGIGLSDSEIDMLLANDIKRVEQELTDRFTWYSKLDSVRREAMIDIAFNLGLTKLLGFKKALAAMESGDYFWASTEFNASRWAEQVGYRADELCDMIETGEYRVFS
jgi:lysozyme